MSRTHQFLGGLSLGLVGQALVIAGGLWLAPFLLHRMGAGEYGLWLIAMQLLAYLALVDLGAVALLPREVAAAAGAGEPGRAERIAGLLGQAAGVLLWQLPVALVVCVGLYLALPAEWATLRPALLFALAGFVLLFPLRLFPALLQGLQDLRFLGTMQIAGWAAGFSLTVGLTVAGAGIRSLAIGWVATQAVICGGCAIRAWHRHRAFLRAGAVALSWRSARAWLGRSSWVALSQLTTILLTGTELLVVGWLAGPAAAAAYACTAKLVTVLANLPNQVMNTAQPALASLRASEAPARTAEVTSALTLLTMIFSGGIAAMVAAGNAGFIRWWVGPSYDLGLAALALLLVNMLLRHWNLSAIYSLFAFGRERRLMVVGAVDGVVTVLATAAAVYWVGPWAAALGSIAGAVAVGLPQNLSALKGELRGAAPQGKLWTWACRGLPLLALAGSAGAVLDPARPALIAAVAAGSAALYLLVVGPMVLRPPLARYAGPLLARVTGAPLPDVQPLASGAALHAPGREER